jgi:hypothetical protein
VTTGLGTGIFMPVNITSILAGTPADRLGVINAVRLMVQNSASVVGTAICLTLLATPLPDGARRAVYAGTIGTDRREIGHVRWESKPKSFRIILMLIPNESG